MEATGGHDLDAVVAEHGAHLLRFAYQLSHDRGQAQDLVQDAFLLLHRRLQRRSDPIDRPAAYLRRIVVNEYVRHRNRRSAETLVGDVPDVPDDEPQPDETLAERDELWTLLGRLAERQRAVLVLRHYELLPDSDIADLLDCRESTVRSLARRGLRALRADPTLPAVTRKGFLIS